MFQPSPILKAYTSLTLAFPNPLATQAAEILENAASRELLEAWLSGDLVLTGDKPRSIPVEQITDEMLVPISRYEKVAIPIPPSAPLNQELPILPPTKLPRLTAKDGVLIPAEKEAAKDSKPGELSKAFKADPGLIHSPRLTKRLKRLASDLGMTLGATLKQMGFPNGAASLRSVLNKKGGVTTVYAMYFESLFGPEVMVQ
jgi:hypothetical protein